MPLYMDRHNVPEAVTPQMAAELHAADYKVQHLFNCTVLTYWFDNDRKTAFCLVNAPNKQALQDMHNASHGEVAHRIIKVDPDVVESFLGRIEHPTTAPVTEVPINEAAFRAIMVIDLDQNPLNQSIAYLKRLNKEIVESILEFEGRVVNQSREKFLASFYSITNAVNCALKIQSQYKNILKSSEDCGFVMKISLSGDAPVTEHEHFFETAIKLAERMCKIEKESIILSSEVKDLYKNESLKGFKESDPVFSLTTADELFLNQVMDYMEKVWNDTSLKVDDFNTQLGLSKSQLYRKMITLIGKSPNTLLKDYRLNKALKLLAKQKGNISEIAFKTGFNSLSYFSKCFQKKYNISPSDYLQSK
ncbi:MAG: DUF4242 domain-containing protein [Calditrichaeota bacterium]|nr:MAG: DUF4242 domain-containing protein [Calditrichota bacterium]MBL1207514.1 DUF4242 domain-containing protein [Calditrichota bacterium]NOG47346.1 DUF4242 domain-containing protein [Calditrichota bacterium]